MDCNLTWEDFSKVKMHVGTIMEATVFEKANKPAYILQVDFGDFGIRKSSAQITKRYQPSTLIGKQVIGVLNFPPKQIANIKSECLILGITGKNGDVILLQPEQQAKNGRPIS